MSIAAPMLVISLIIYAGLFGLFIYLVILIIRALKKYIRSKDVRAEKSVLKQNLGEVLKDLRTKNKRRKAYMIYSKYDVIDDWNDTWHKTADPRFSAGKFSLFAALAL